MDRYNPYKEKFFRVFNNFYQYKGVLRPKHLRTSENNEGRKTQ